MSDNGAAPKDFNELLKARPEIDGELVKAWLTTAPTLVDVLCAEVGDAVDDEDKAERTRRAIRVTAMLDDATLVHKRKKLAGMMSVSKGELENLLKAERTGTKDADEGDEELPTAEIGLRSLVIDDHLIDFVYDKPREQFKLAVRYPDGRLDVLPHLDLKGYRYMAVQDAELISSIKNRGVVFATGLGKHRNEAGELVEPDIQYLFKRIKALSYKYLDIGESDRAICSYYVIFTWLQDCFSELAYLMAQGPYGRGKSRFVDTFSFCAYRVMRAAGLSSLSPVFRTLDSMGGTLAMDEISAPGRPVDGELEMLFKGGNSRSAPPIWRTEGGANNSLFPKSFDVYGCKIFGSIKDFSDPATNSRCIKVKMYPKVRTDIPRSIENEFFEEAEQIRNLCLSYRLRHWQPEIKIIEERIDDLIDPRLQQITGGLLTIIDDEAVRVELTRIMREYNKELTEAREETVAAKVVWALLEILKEEPVATSQMGVPQWNTKIKRVLEMVKKRIFDEEEADPIFKVDADGNEVKDLSGEAVMDVESPRNDKKHWVNRMSPKKLSNIIREDLHLPVEHATWDKNKAKCVVIGDPERAMLKRMEEIYGLKDLDGEAVKTTPVMSDPKFEFDGDVPEMPGFEDGD
jgi:hypothetical protein